MPINPTDYTDDTISPTIFTKDGALTICNDVITICTSEYDICGRKISNRTSTVFTDQTINATQWSDT